MSRIERWTKIQPHHVRTELARRGYYGKSRGRIYEPVGPWRPLVRRHLRKLGVPALVAWLDARELRRDPGPIGHRYP